MFNNHPMLMLKTRELPSDMFPKPFNQPNYNIPTIQRVKKDVNALIYPGDWQRTRTFLRQSTMQRTPDRSRKSFKINGQWGVGQSITSKQRILSPTRTPSSSQSLQSHSRPRGKSMQSTKYLNQSFTFERKLRKDLGSIIEMCQY